MSTEKVCRLCLDVIEQETYEYLKDEDFKKENPSKEYISLNYKQMLRGCIPEINLELTEVPLICVLCTNYLMASDIYRYQLMETEEKILALQINSENLRSLRELVEFKSGKRPTPICRTCLSVTNKVRPLYVTPNFNSSFLLMMLKDCYPGINLSLTAQPSICVTCTVNLQKFYVFRQKCLEKDSIIIEYITKYRVQIQSINLAKVIHNIPPSLLQTYYSNNTSDIDNKITIKKEILEETHSVLPSCDIKIENLNEETFIKEEENNENTFLDSTETLENDSQGCHFLAASIFPSTSSSGNLETNGSDENMFYTQSDYLLTEDGTTQSISSKTCVKCIDSTEKCTHEGKKTVDWYKCDFCNYQTHWKHHLNRHKQIHDKESTDDKMYRCKLCPFESKFKHSIIRHNTLDHADSYKCNECSFTTKFKFCLSEHVKDVHNHLEVWHKCTECSYITKWKYHLKRHMFKHSK